MAIGWTWLTRWLTWPDCSGDGGGAFLGLVSQGLVARAPSLTLSPPRSATWVHSRLSGGPLLADRDRDLEQVLIWERASRIKHRREER